MKVILLQDVEKFGKAGDVKEVRNGYGFNFLLPQGLAEFATPRALKHSSSLIATRHKELEQQKDESKNKAQSIEGIQLVIVSKADRGKLFGSVGREDIVDALRKMDREIDATSIILKKAFREIGSYPVTADFGNNILASFTVEIRAE